MKDPLEQNRRADEFLKKIATGKGKVRDFVDLMANFSIVLTQLEVESWKDYITYDKYVESILTMIMGEEKDKVKLIMVSPYKITTSFPLKDKDKEEIKKLVGGLITSIIAMAGKKSKSVYN